MAFLAFFGHVAPSEYRQMDWRDAKELERQLVNLAKQDIDLRIQLARLSAGLPSQ